MNNKSFMHLRYRSAVISPGNIAISQIPQQPRPEGWARLQVLACGICGTDLHLLHGMTLPAGATYPVFPGHEVAARVVESDPKTGPEPGTTVVLHPLLPCGVCPACTSDQENQCREAEMLGIHRRGGLADELLWRSDRLVEVGGLDPILAAILPDAVATAWHAVERAALPAGGKLAVIGTGGVGTNVLHIARALDPSSQIVAVVHSDGTAERIQALGFPVFQGLDGAGRSMRQKFGEFDVVVDFSGVAAAPSEGIRMLRRGGRLVLGAILDERFRLATTYSGLVTREIEIVGSYSSTIDDLRAVVKLVSTGVLPMNGMVSHVIDLADARHALQILEQRPTRTVRVVVQP